MQEYATTVKSCDAGLTWETHFKVKKQFEVSYHSAIDQQKSYLRLTCHRCPTLQFMCLWFIRLFFAVYPFYKYRLITVTLGASVYGKNSKQNYGCSFALFTLITYSNILHCVVYFSLVFFWLPNHTNVFRLLV